MKKFILYLLKLGLLSSIIFTICVLGIILSGDNVFGSTYQSVIQRKFDVLMKTEEPKIIIIGGSNTAFGIDEELLERETGYKVVNLGLHASMGAIIPTELSKANINEGDIVLLAYEWDWFAEGYFERLGTDLVVSGIDTRIDMYRYLPAELYPKFIGYLWEYAEKKSTFKGTEGIYSSYSFDENGSMILERPDTMMAYEGNEGVYGIHGVTYAVIGEDVKTYLKEYKEYVESKNAEIYFVSSPIYKGAVASSIEDFQALVTQEENTIGIEYLSNPEDYLFPNEYIYDTVYHCTDAGEKYRTELLVKDLMGVLH